MLSFVTGYTFLLIARLLDTSATEMYLAFSISISGKLNNKFLLINILFVFIPIDKYRGRNFMVFVVLRIVYVRTNYIHTFKILKVCMCKR